MVCGKRWFADPLGEGGTPGAPAFADMALRWGGPSSPRPSAAVAETGGGGGGRKERRRGENEVAAVAGEPGRPGGRPFVMVDAAPARRWKEEGEDDEGEKKSERRLCSPAEEVP